MTLYDLALEFLAKADEDAVAARKFRDDADIADSVLGFHCQQALEKTRKAVLAAGGVANGLALPGGIDGAAIRGLTPFAVEHRYEPLAPPPDFGRSAAVALIAQVRARAEGQLQRLAPATP
jgi:hypothetical protein